MNKTEVVFSDFLKEHNLQFTSQRSFILKEFIGAAKHLSVEELYGRVKEKEPAIGQVTVFRTLKLLVEAGIAGKVNFADKITRYEMKLGHEHHDHLICTGCGKVIEVLDMQLEKIQEKLEEMHKSLDDTLESLSENRMTSQEIGEKMEEINLDGEMREMTVLFSDVRGFTSISESLEPKELTSYINAFLTPITKVIHDNRGTIDKYMGDAVMAFWGAPLADDQHALHALNAAINIVERMHTLREEFAEKQWPEIYVGIGINTGIFKCATPGNYRLANDGIYQFIVFVVYIYL